MVTCKMTCVIQGILPSHTTFTMLIYVIMDFHMCLKILHLNVLSPWFDFCDEIQNNYFLTMVLCIMVDLCRTLWGKHCKWQHVEELKWELNWKVNGARILHFWKIKRKKWVISMGFIYQVDDLFRKLMYIFHYSPTKLK